MFYLGLDSGTQSIKSIIVDVTTGEIVASSQAAYSLIPDLPPGHMEQNPRDWIEAARTCIRECTDQLGVEAQEIRGIGVSAQQHGLVVLDEHDQPIRPAKLWCDTSTTEQCEQFAAAFGGVEGLLKLAGNPILPGYTAGKILWIKQKEPENFARIASILLPHDYLNFWLTGEKRMEYGDASGTGLLDVRTRLWSDPLIDFIGPEVRKALPRLGASSQPAGRLRADLADFLGLPPGILVSAGGGDNMMGAIGTGNTSPGRVTVSLGTSGTLYAYSAEPAIDRHGEAAAFCDSTDAWLPLVCTMNVTVATEQVCKLFSWDHKTLEKEVGAAPAGAGGLLFLPYLNGERTPNLPLGTGVLHGLTTSNMRPGLIARAVVEGVTLGLAFGLARFAEMGIHPTELRVTGGGSKSPVWRQILADVMGVPAVGLSTTEGAALGGALQAAWQDGRYGTLEELVARNVALDETTRVQPNPVNHALYKELLQRQTGMMQALHGAGHL
jgi:xylulokinase